MFEVAIPGTLVLHFPHREPDTATRDSNILDKITANFTTLQTARMVAERLVCDEKMLLLLKHQRKCQNEKKEGLGKRFLAERNETM